MDSIQTIRRWVSLLPLCLGILLAMLAVDLWWESNHVAATSNPPSAFYQKTTELLLQTRARFIEGSDSPRELAGFLSGVIYTLTPLACCFVATGLWVALSNRRERRD